MIIKKLRLQRGWSQDQLAQLSGISTRTIQRMEQGKKASVESLKSLAAVFEVNFDELQQEPEAMKIPINQSSNVTNNVTNEEAIALYHVKKVKGFYTHLIRFIVIMSFLFILNYLTSPNYIWAWWTLLGWGIGIIFHGLKVFNVIDFFGPEWEKKQVEKQLGRKL